MIGIAIRIAPYAATVRVVMNGSVTPRVTGLRSPSGWLTIFSSQWFCQKQSPSATPNAPSMMMMRVRSSSRCSTRLSRSSWPIGRMRRATEGGAPTPLGGVGGLGGAGGRRLLVRRGRDGRGRRDGGGLLGVPLLELLVVVVAGHGVLELAHAAPERAAEVGQPLGPENQEHDDQDDDDLDGADVRHGKLPFGAGPPPMVAAESAG